MQRKNDHKTSNQLKCKHMRATSNRAMLFSCFLVYCAKQLESVVNNTI